MSIIDTAAGIYGTALADALKALEAELSAHRMTLGLLQALKDGQVTLEEIEVTGEGWQVRKTG